MGDAPYPPDDFGPAFDAAAARLRAAVGRACAESGPWPGRVCAVIDAVLRFAAEDPTAIRLLLIESWGRREDAAHRREALLHHFATLLVWGREQPLSASELPGVAEEYLIGALAARLARELDDSSVAVGSSALGPELAEFILLHYLDPVSARMWSRYRHPGLGRLRGGPMSGVLDPATFGEALSLLQGIIGTEAQIVLNLAGRFFDCGFHARLERVETLAGDDGPVLLVFAGAPGIALYAE